MNRLAMILVVIALLTGIALGAWLRPAASVKPSAAPAQDAVLYWYDPMHPDQHFDKPGRSPFMDMDLSYAFRVTMPDESISLGVDVHDKAGTLLFAAFTGRRRPLTDGRLLGAFLAHPLLAGRVLGGIHWEALKLWWKGMHLRPRPAPPAAPITISSRGHIR